jgi:preprotein translocase subunit YajC
MDWLLLLAEGEQGGMETLMKSGLVPILLFFVVMMIFMGRSSARQRREQEARLAAVKKNDKVITSAGIIGIVYAINDNEVTLKVDETSNTRIRVLKSSIMHVNPDDPAQLQAQTQQPQQPTT